MQQSNESSRKKFLWWGASVAAAFAGLRIFNNQKKAEPVKNIETVKMLTQDGQLVEIDKSLLVSGSKKVSNDELKQWVNKK